MHDPFDRHSVLAESAPSSPAHGGSASHDDFTQEQTGCCCCRACCHFDPCARLNFWGGWSLLSVGLQFVLGKAADRGAETWTGALDGIPAGQAGSLGEAFAHGVKLAARRGSCCGLMWWYLWYAWVVVCCGRAVPEQLAYEHPRIATWNWACTIVLANLLAAIVLLRFGSVGDVVSGTQWAV